MDIEFKLAEIRENELLTMELDRALKENLSLKRRILGLQKREINYKRIISKQNKRIQEYDPKDKYINKKGRVKKRHYF